MSLTEALASTEFKELKMSLESLFLSDESGHDRFYVEDEPDWDTATSRMASELNTSDH